MQTFWIEDKHSGKGFHHDGNIETACKVAQDWCFSDWDKVVVWLDEVRLAEVEKSRRWLSTQGRVLMYEATK